MSDQTIAKLACCICLLLVSSSTCTRGTSRHTQLDKAIDGTVAKPANPKSPAEIANSLDASQRELVLGSWTDNYKGRRTLTVRPDGTATMVVEPNGMGALFATRLVFQERWQIADGQFNLTAVSGTPKKRANFILSTMGRVSNNRILTLSKDRLILLDADEKTKYNWRKVAP